MFILAGFAVLPISYINTTFRKSYVSRGPWFMNVTLHALKTTTVFGEYMYSLRGCDMETGTIK